MPRQSRIDAPGILHHARTFGVTQPAITYAVRGERLNFMYVPEAVLRPTQPE
jgi:hypothetical protein